MSFPCQLRAALCTAGTPSPALTFSRTTSPRTKLSLSTSRCSSWSCPPLVLSCGGLWQQAIAKLQMREAANAGRLSAHLVSYLLILSSTATDRGFGQRSVISMCPRRDCQEPVLPQYKVCCSTVSGSNFPPELLLTRGDFREESQKAFHDLAVWDSTFSLLFPGGEVSGFQ